MNTLPPEMHEAGFDAAAGLAMAALLTAMSGRAVPFAGAARPMTRQGVQQACEVIGTDPANLWRMLGGRLCGFFGDRRPQIVFERHLFSVRTRGAFDEVAPEVSSPRPGGYRRGSAEYGRLAVALSLDRRAALESTQWGIGRVMGHAAVDAGFSDVESFVQAHMQSEDAQLAAFAVLARGRAQAPVASEFRIPFRTRSEPDLDVREAQLGLVLLGYAGETLIDGVLGGRTRTALRKFQQDEGLWPAEGVMDARTVQRIRTRAGWAV
jgi:hypothetical protein